MDSLYLNFLHVLYKNIKMPTTSVWIRVIVHNYVCNFNERTISLPNI